jgi:cation:H+ antiporter
VVLALLLAAAGLALLVQAANQFVTGAARLAVVMRISPVIVGAVVIGFGTSLPEILVSGSAAARGDLDLGVGNIIGSNVANLSIVLGVAALLVPVVVSRTTLRREAPLAVAATVLFAVLVQDGFERWEGVVFAAALVTAMAVLVRAARAERNLAGDLEGVPAETASISQKAEVFRTIVGLIGTVIGAQLLIEGFTRIAGEAGLGTGFVGLTMVAMGTSAPEMVTAIVAVRGGHSELVLGNVLGSNLLNSLAGGGVMALVGPGMLTDENLAGLATYTMLIVTALAIVFMITSRRIVRWEAAVLAVIYLAAIPFLVSSEDDLVSEDAAGVVYELEALDVGVVVVVAGGP